jgi:hypothetical protein
VVCFLLAFAPLVAGILCEYFAVPPWTDHMGKWVGAGGGLTAFLAIGLGLWLWLQAGGEITLLGWGGVLAVVVWIGGAVSDAFAPGRADWLAHAWPVLVGVLCLLRLLELLLGGRHGAPAPVTPPESDLDLAARDPLLPPEERQEFERVTARARRLALGSMALGGAVLLPVFVLALTSPIMTGTSGLVLVGIGGGIMLGGLSWAAVVSGQAGRRLRQALCAAQEKRTAPPHAPAESGATSDLD